MRTKLFIFILAIVVACFLGCRLSRPTLPKDAFTKQIGKWQAANLPPVPLASQSAVYQTTEAGTVKEIRLELYLPGNAEETANAFRERTECSKKPEYAARAPEVLKEQSVKDKSGNVIGAIKICQQNWSSKSLEKGFGEDSFKIFLRNHNLIESFETYGSIITDGGKKTVSFNDLIEFVKGVPQNLQVDFSDLNLEVLPPFKSGNSITAEELRSLTAPMKIAQKPYFKGKVVVFQGDTITSSYFDIPENIQAKTAAETQTVVQVNCEKGRKIGDYTVLGDGRRLSAYAKTCKVTVIDRTIPATIAQKTFVNNEEPGYQQYGFGSEYVAPDPTDNIKKYLSGFARQ